MKKYTHSKLKRVDRAEQSQLARRVAPKTVERIFGSKSFDFGASLGAVFNKVTGAIGKVRRAKSSGVGGVIGEDRLVIKPWTSSGKTVAQGELVTVLEENSSGGRKFLRANNEQIWGDEDQYKYSTLLVL
jgi:hypothetical protein